MMNRVNRYLTIRAPRSPSCLRRSASRAGFAQPQAPAAGAPAPGRAGGPPNPPLLMTTTAFQDGGVIPRQVHAGSGPGSGVAGAQLVAGAARHAELRAAPARPRAGPQQGLEDGHHALADLEHSRHVDRTAGRCRHRRAARRLTAGEPAAAAQCVYGTRRRPRTALTTTTPSNCMRWTSSSTCRKDSRRAQLPRGPPSSTRWTDTCLAKRSSSDASIGSPRHRQTH